MSCYILCKNIYKFISWLKYFNFIFCKILSYLILVKILKTDCHYKTISLFNVFVLFNNKLKIYYIHTYINRNLSAHCMFKKFLCTCNYVMICAECF